MKPVPTLEQERTLRNQGYAAVAGVDEAGRGPLAGPVVAAAVVLAPLWQADWLGQVRDSKVLTPARREYLARCLKHEVATWGLGMTGPREIDRVGIGRACLLAMRRAVDRLHPRPDFVLVDGLFTPRLALPCRPIVDGDALCLSIAAASILAKVARDELMLKVDRRYPGYGFAHHKGYGTPEHLQQLRLLGPSPVHRRSFRPVRDFLSGPQGKLF